MTAVIQPFSQTFFNALPHIDDVCQRDLTVQVEAVKKIIFAHGLSDVVGVSRVHKHVDLNDGEVLVAKADAAGGQVAVDFRVPADGELLVPFQVVYDGSQSNWAPVGMWDTGSNDGDKIKAAYDRVVACPALLDEVAAAAADLDGVCLTLRFQDIISPNGDPLLETTDDKARTQLFRLASSVRSKPGSGIVTTHWYWNGDGSAPQDGCMSWCDGEGRCTGDHAVGV